MVDLKTLKKNSPIIKLTARPRFLSTRPPLARMQQIFQSIKKGNYPNRIRLAEDIEVTTKTIQRDIDFMRDRLSLPISYNGERQGYELTEQVENFPMIELTESEIVSVFVAQKALVQYKGTSFEQPLKSAFKKLASSLEGKVSISWDGVDSLISFRSFETTPTDLSIFQKVSESVWKKVYLEFEYKKLNSRSYEKRKIEPYHLACILNQWYCFGYDVKRKEIRTFVLARMRCAQLTKASFTPSKKFSIQDYLKESFGVFSAKGKYKVRVRFDSFAAQLVRERVWHPSQTIQELTGGGLELLFILSSLEEIEPWILSWGTHAKVIAPKELISRIRKTAQYQLRQYSA